QDLRAIVGPRRLVLERLFRGSERIQLVLDRAGPPEQGADLAFVGPAEHVAGPVIDTAPVVLLVPAAGPLDLARLGDRPRQAAEVSHGLDALIGSAGGQFALQPRGELGVLDVELAVKLAVAAPGISGRGVG